MLCLFMSKIEKLLFFASFFSNPVKQSKNCKKFSGRDYGIENYGIWDMDCKGIILQKIKGLN